LTASVVEDRYRFIMLGQSPAMNFDHVKYFHASGLDTREIPRKQKRHLPAYGWRPWHMHRANITAK